MAQRVFSGEIAGHKSPADNGYRLRTQVVAWAEEAAIDERNVELGEKSGAHRQPQRTLKVAGNQGTILDLAIVQPAVVAEGKRNCQFGLLYAGQGAQIFQAGVLPCSHLFRRIVTRGGGMDSEGEHMGGVVAIGRVQHRPHAFGHERRADDQRHGQRDLGTGEEVPQPAGATGAGNGAGAGFQLVHQVDAQGGQGRRKAGDGSRRHGQQQRKGQGVSIQRDVVPSRQKTGHSGRHGDEREVHLEQGDQQSAGPADQPQQNVFGKQLPHQPPAMRMAISGRRAMPRANCKLAMLRQTTSSTKSVATCIMLK